MPEKMNPEERILLRKMLQALRAEPVVPRHAANAAFALMCLALSKMAPDERDQLLGKIDAAARSQVTSLLQQADAGARLKWVN
jgi:hypothetical protein